MKLFAVVFGAAVAASMVAAQITPPDVADVIVPDDIMSGGSCSAVDDGYSYYYVDVKNPGPNGIQGCATDEYSCAEDDDSMTSIKAALVGVPYKSIDAVCCGDGNYPGDQCSDLWNSNCPYLEGFVNSEERGGCNGCIYVVYTPPTPTGDGYFCPGTCEEPCCPDNIGSFNEVLTDDGPFEGYKGPEFDTTKLLFSDSLQTTGWVADESDDKKWCLPATCTCCENLGTTAIIKPFMYTQQVGYGLSESCGGEAGTTNDIDAISPPFVQSFPGANAFVCVTDDGGNGEFTAISDSMGMVYDDKDAMPYPYATHLTEVKKPMNAIIVIGCHEKLDGSNTAKDNSPGGPGPSPRTST